MRRYRDGEDEDHEAHKRHGSMYEYQHEAWHLRVMAERHAFEMEEHYHHLELSLERTRALCKRSGIPIGS
jgi:hypothetical protein